MDTISAFSGIDPIIKTSPRRNEHVPALVLFFEPVLCVVKLYEKVVKNCTMRKESWLLYMTIVTFSIHPFDKPRGKWYCDIGISCKESILFL